MSKTLNRPKAGRLSNFDPRRRGTDEASLLKRDRPDLLDAKAHPSPRRRLAGRLTYLRQSLGLSQAAMAKKAGVGLATYQRIEQCQPSANPGLDVLEKLAKALKVDFDQLWRGPGA